jgi:hypothetical protein
MSGTSELENYESTTPIGEKWDLLALTIPHRKAAGKFSPLIIVFKRARY